MPWRLLSFTRPASFRIAAPLAVVLAVLLIVTNEAGYRATERLTAERDAVNDARLAVSRLRRDLIVMESSQRGYMLTGRPEYREPYDRAQAELAAAIGAVRQLADGPDGGARPELRQLADAAEHRVSELAEVLRLFDARELDKAMELMLTDIGREQMEQVNRLVDGVLAEAERAYAAGGAMRERVRLWSRVAIVALVLLCLAAVRAAIRLHRERMLERAQHVRELAAERDKLEAEVTRRTAELSDLARHLQSVREDERSRLARELHDELGGLLTAAKLDVARVRKRVTAGTADAADTAERIDHLSRTLDAGIALKRRIIEDLRPSTLDHLGLQRTLEILCAEFARRTEIEVHTELADLRLEPERALAVFRLVQEALTNAAKHAGARRIDVSLQADGAQARIRVHDDGAGFDPTRVRAGAHGLAGMRFRMQSCGGQLRLQSAPGAGTTIEASLPL